MGAGLLPVTERQAMNRLVVVGVVAALLAAPLALVGPVVQADAAGVPPAVMPACGLPGGGSGAPVGGWNVRDFVAVGAFPSNPDNVLDTAPIRPLSARLGEVCFDDLGHLTVPVLYSEAPIPALDEDDDGQDDGAPELGDCTPEPVSNPRTVSEVGGLRMQCAGIDMACLGGAGGGSSNCPSGLSFERGDTVGLSVSLTDSNTVTVHISVTGVSSHVWSQGFILELWCKDAGGALPSVTDVLVSKTYSTSVASSDEAMSCTGGTSSTRVPWRVIAVSRLGAPAESGNRVAVALWATDDLDPLTYPGQRYYGGAQGARIGIPGFTPDGQPDGYVRCSESYAATTTFDLEIAGVAGDAVGPIYGEPPRVEGGVATDWSVVQNEGLSWYPYITTDDCPYLVEVSMWVNVYQGRTEAEVGHVLANWSADRWRLHHPYSDGGDPLGTMCKLYPERPGCFELNNPPYIDGTDFDAVCAGSPEFTWGDWSWLASFVGHYARCLFVPANGFDRNGEVVAAWTGGPGGDLDSLVHVGVEALSIDGVCGVLVSAPIGGSAVEIDTCSWTYAPPLRQFLFWVVLVLGYLGIYRFIIDVILAVPAGGRMPNPVSF